MHTWQILIKYLLLQFLLPLIAAFASSDFKLKREERFPYFSFKSKAWILIIVLCVTTISTYLIEIQFDKPTELRFRQSPYFTALYNGSGQYKIPIGNFGDNEARKLKIHTVLISVYPSENFKYEFLAPLKDHRREQLDAQKSWEVTMGLFANPYIKNSNDLVTVLFVKVDYQDHKGIQQEPLEAGFYWWPDTGNAWTNIGDMTNKVIPNIDQIKAEVINSKLY